MITTGLIKRTLNNNDVLNGAFTINNAMFNEIINIDSNGGAISMENKVKKNNFDHVIFIRCKSVVSESCGGAMFLKSLNTTIRGNAITLQECTANYGQSMYIEFVYNSKLDNFIITKTKKNELPRQDNTIELRNTIIQFMNGNETDNNIKGRVSCIKLISSKSFWDHCMITNNTCYCCSLFINGGNHYVSNILFNSNTQKSHSNDIEFIGSVNIEAHNVNNRTFNIKRSNNKNNFSFIRRKLDDATTTVTYFDKESFYQNRDNVDDSVNMLFVYVAVPIICFVIFLIGIIWFFIAKLYLPNYFFDDNKNNDEDNILNDPKFTDDRYFLDRNVSAQVTTTGDDVQTSVRKKHRIKLSDGEEEDGYYSDDDNHKDKKDGMVLKEIRSKNNNPLWAAALMNDTDDPFGNDFEEDDAVRLYKKGSSVAPQIPAAANATEDKK